MTKSFGLDSLFAGTKPEVVSRESRGFSLVELLAAVAVSAVLATLCFTVANGMLMNWSRASNRLSVQSKARFILDRIESDLESANWRRDGKVGLIATVLDRSDNSNLWQSATLEKPRSVQLATHENDQLRFGQAGVWLRFFSSRNGSNETDPSEATARTLSAPTAIAYQLIRRARSSRESTRPARYYLHRNEVRVAQIGGRPGAIESGFDLDPAASSHAYSATGDTMEEGDPASIQRPEPRESILAEDVIDFGVRLFTRNEKGKLTTIFPTADADREFEVRASLNEASDDASWPRTLEVFVRVLSAEGALQIEALEMEKMGVRPSRFANDSEWWWSVALSHSELFSRQVELHSSSP